MGVARPHWVRELAKDWVAAYGGTVPWKQICGHCKQLVDAYPFSQVQIHFRHYLAAHQNGRSDFASPAKFAQTFASWAPPSRSAISLPYQRQSADDADRRAGISLKGESPCSDHPA